MSNPSHEDFTPMFPKSFIVLGLIFRSLIHFELIFVCSIIFVLFFVAIQLF